VLQTKQFFGKTLWFLQRLLLQWTETLQRDIFYLGHLRRCWNKCRFNFDWNRINESRLFASWISSFNIA